MIQRPAAGGWEHDRYAATVDVLPSQRLDKSGRERRSAKLVITNLHYEVSERELEVSFVLDNLFDPLLPRMYRNNLLIHFLFILFFNEQLLFLQIGALAVPPKIRVRI